MTTLTRNTLGLRDALFEEIDKVRAGEILPSRASAVARAAGQILASMKLEMEHARFRASMGKPKDGAELIPAIELGSPQ